jgi:hypothetical protein
MRSQIQYDAGKEELEYNIVIKQSHIYMPISKGQIYIITTIDLVT